MRLCTNNIIVRILDMEESVPAVTIPDTEGYNVYLNAKVSYEMQVMALKHELSHIEHKHFDSVKPLLSKEDEVDNFIYKY